MAVMDGFNFHFKHNNGFWSLNYKGSNDAWHWLKRGILAMIFYILCGFEPLTFEWWLNVFIYILLAWWGQFLIYKLIIKSL
jgi:hypothetical protein